MTSRCVSLVLALLVVPAAGCVAGSLSARGWIAAPGVWSNDAGTAVLDASEGWGGWLKLSIDAEQLSEGWGGVGGGYRGVWTSDGDLDLVGRTRRWELASSIATTERCGSTPTRRGASRISRPWCSCSSSRPIRTRVGRAFE
jgi:hypothetical protein